VSAGGFGILACGSYVPRGRLSQRVIADAHGWFAPSLKSSKSQSRSFCNWDEDSLTMAVEASRNCISASMNIASIELASTTQVFADRSNSGVLREALDIEDSVALADSGGSLRAASSALSRALADMGDGNRLIVASDCVESKPASASEPVTGHAAAGIVVGHGEPVATLRGAASLHQDFVDHYRAAGDRFSYSLEARWARDAGYRKQVTEVFARALESAGIAANGIDQLAVSGPPPLPRSIAKALGFADTGADLQQSIGFCGAAQPLLLLNELLASARSGDTVALLSVGQGIDVLVFDVISEGAGPVNRDGLQEENYCRYLALRDLLELETGIRAERDNRTVLAAFWRKHDAITGFKGGHCSECGTLQFPPSKVCVSCSAEGSQKPRRLADMQGKVRSFTEDWLAFTPRPPLVFGNVGFEDHANVMMEFTDVEPGQLEVGMPVDLRFRVKDFDDKRGFRRYFWKSSPAGVS
jgi:3-hydroxy-3-methylglutaryl CoA synthase